MQDMACMHSQSLRKTFSREAFLSQLKHVDSESGLGLERFRLEGPRCAVVIQSAKDTLSNLGLQLKNGLSLGLELEVRLVRTNLSAWRSGGRSA